jgi:hypothetical protein
MLISVLTLLTTPRQTSSGIPPVGTPFRDFVLQSAVRRLTDSSSPSRTGECSVLTQSARVPARYRVVIVLFEADDAALRARRLHDCFQAFDRPAPGSACIIRRSTRKQRLRTTAPFASTISALPAAFYVRRENPRRRRRQRPRHEFCLQHPLLRPPR